MGIGGSGISAVSLMAKKLGYKVSGCDLEKDTAYMNKVKKDIDVVLQGHNREHLENIDLLVVTPSVLFQNAKHPEVVEAKKRKILMTWQEFVGKYLHVSKRIICIAGTHGKSTVAAITSLAFEAAGENPSAIVGATVKKWQSNYRFGQGDIFITEADEFYDNFLNYRPEAIILNNIEFDHPDYFKSERDVIISFHHFVNNLIGRKLLIINQDSIGINKLLKSLDNKFLNSIELVGYTLKKPVIDTKISFKAKIVKELKDLTSYSVSSRAINFSEEFELRIPGKFNVANSLGVIALACLYNIDIHTLKRVLSSYSGIGRRLEVLGQVKGIFVYDDYAHHPTAIKATLSGLRQKYPKNRIWVVIEAHSYSRTKALLKEYQGIFKDADRVIIAPIFAARDKKTFGVSGQSIVDIANHKSAIFIDSFNKITNYLKSKTKKGDIVIVMGAGKSYQLARMVFSQL